MVPTLDLSYFLDLTVHMQKIAITVCLLLSEAQLVKLMNIHGKINAQRNMC